MRTSLKSMRTSLKSLKGSLPYYAVSILLIIAIFVQQTLMAGIPSEVVGITDDTSSAGFDNTVGVLSGVAGDKGIEIAEEGIKTLPSSGFYTKLGTVSKIIKWGGFTIGTIDTVRDTYTLITDESKHITYVGKMTDKGLALIGVGMGWAATIGTIVTIGATAPVTGTAAVVTSTGFAVAAGVVAVTRAVVNTETVRKLEAILSGNRRAIGFAPFETPGFKENRQVVKEMLGFDPYDHTDDEIPDPNTGIPVYKPNIYVYSDTDLTASIHVYPSQWITASIPEYQEGPGWTAHVVNGSLNGSNDFLFYEAIVPRVDFQQRTGWPIRQGTLREDLEAMLAPYQFNAKEAQDFMDFWVPMLTGSEDLIAFPQDNAIVDLLMPLRIEPSPDKVYRVWFYFVPAKAATAIAGSPIQVPTNIPAIDHSGYSVVEWGGLK